MKTRLQYIITNEGLTNARFAELLGVNPASVSHILAERNKPSFDFIVKIAENLPQYDLRWLLTGKGNPIAVGISPDPIDAPVATTTNANIIMSQQCENPDEFAPSATQSNRPENCSLQNYKTTKLIVCFPDGTFEEYNRK